MPTWAPASAVSSDTRFRRGIENRGFNQIKTFLRQITPKIKLRYFSGKKNCCYVHFNLTASLKCQSSLALLGRGGVLPYKKYGDARHTFKGLKKWFCYLLG